MFAPQPRDSLRGRGGLAIPKPTVARSLGDSTSNSVLDDENNESIGLGAGAGKSLLETKPKARRAFGDISNNGVHGGLGGGKATPLRTPFKTLPLQQKDHNSHRKQASLTVEKTPSIRATEKQRVSRLSVSSVEAPERAAGRLGDEEERLRSRRVTRPLSPCRPFLAGHSITPERKTRCIDGGDKITEQLRVLREKDLNVMLGEMGINGVRKSTIHTGSSMLWVEEQHAYETVRRAEDDVPAVEDESLYHHEHEDTADVHI